jgi:flagellar hook-associated protein 3 FlgL
MTRIATATQYDAGVTELQRRQRELSDAQARLTSGKRVMRPSDDPTAAARAERALAQERLSIANQRGADSARNAMTLTEEALGNAVDLMQTARETLVAAGNASFGPGEREALAEKLRGMRAQLLNIANRPDGSGGYLFAGQGSTAPPFIDGVGGVRFEGAPGTVQVASGESLPLTTDGQAVWMRAPTGNGVFTTGVLAQNGGAWIDTGTVINPSALTGSDYEIHFTDTPAGPTYTVFENGVATAQANVPYQSGKAIEFGGMSVTISGTPANADAFSISPSTPTLSLFATLDRAIDALSRNDLTSGERSQTVNHGIRDIDAGLNRLQTARSAAGETLSRIDGISDRLDALQLSAKTTRSDAEDLDMVQAISEFSSQQTGYDAALKAYAQVQKMSLFQYINV